MLLYAGANVRATTRLGGYTPLHLASQRGHDAAIEALLKGGANPNLPTVTGATPLMLAAASGHVAAVKQLLAHKADVNAKENANDQTALMFAAAYDRPEVVKVLVELGADVAVDVEGDGHLVAGLSRRGAAGRDSPGDAAHADQRRRQVRGADAHRAAAAGQAGERHPGRDPWLPLQRADRQAGRPLGPALRRRARAASPR